MSKQTFKAVGITETNGVTKIRFTDDWMRRLKQFVTGGATRTDFIDLPRPMTKIEALEYMKTHPTFSSEDDQATISDTLEDKMKAPRSSSVPKITTLAEIASRKIVVTEK